MKSHHGHGHPRRPTILITPDINTPTPESPLLRYELKVAYADAVLRAGGLPSIVPYTEDRQIIEAHLERAGGVLLSGGGFDIPPEAYGETAREGMGPTKPARTKFETELLRAAMERNLPVLGICGGMQLLNVAMGGTLFQDIARECEGAKTHQQDHDRAQPHHPVEVKGNSVLGECVGKGQLMVNSTHHQSVKACGPKVQVTATAPDGVIEGIEVQGYPFAVGVQWHPELLIDTVPPHLGLYRSFVARARDHRR